MNSNRVPVVDGPTLKSGKREIPTLVGTMRVDVLVPDPEVGRNSKMMIPLRDTPTMSGYQRKVSPKRVRELKEQLRKGRVDLPTAVLLSLRNASLEMVVEEADTKHRFFRIDHVSSEKFNVVDGQHRLKALEELAQEDYATWREYPIPFVCMIGADEFEEMQQFYVVNSTAKSVKTDLAYDILRQKVVENPDIRLDLVAQNREWQVLGQEIAGRLAQECNVWIDRIRFANQPLGTTTISSSALVNSLKPMLAPQQYAFRSLNVDDQVKVIDAFWSGVQICLPNAFEDPQRYALQKGPGVFALHGVFGHVFEYIRAEGNSVFQAESFAVAMRESLQELAGENTDGEIVSGVDFWGSRGGAASAYSSHGGRRVLAARIANRLPAIKVT